MFSPSSCATRRRLRREILPVLSSSKSLNTFSMSSRVSFSPILPVIISELAELDGAIAVVVDVGDHLLELLLLHFEAEGTHSSLELTHINGARVVRIEQVEGLADLLDLLLGKATLGFLLCCSTARHDVICCFQVPPC